MKLSEIIKEEKAGIITIYKQGIFWVAYEYSAYYIQQIKNYKINVKFIKALNKNIISLGFPDSSLKIFDENKKIILFDNTSTYKKFVIEYKFCENDFWKWRENLEKTKGDKEIQDSLVEEIRKFPLEKKTPIEAFLFIKNLKNNID
jgi:uncharacterized protein YeeX (DUF496 family)